MIGFYLLTVKKSGPVNALLNSNTNGQIATNLN